MISKSFIIITLVILASSLTSSVNSTVVPARQFIFFGLVTRCRRTALLTSDLGFARQESRYVQAAVPTAMATTNPPFHPALLALFSAVYPSLHRLSRPHPALALALCPAVTQALHRLLQRTARRPP